jgi:tetratricopeptide (TPR) repeat protein
MSREECLNSTKKALKENDMDAACKHMSALVQLGTALSANEEGMLYAAYKNAAGKRRYEIQKKSGGEKTKSELLKICQDGIAAFEAALKCATETHSKIFLNKAIGDFQRYIEEVQSDQKNKDAALKCYQIAHDLAIENDCLAPTDPLRLNVCLNFGVFYQETMGDAAKGLQITQEAIDAARPALLKLTDEKQKGTASFVLSMLHANACMWAKDLHKAAPKPIEGLLFQNEVKAAAPAPQPKREAPTDVIKQTAEKPQVQA